MTASQPLSSPLPPPKPRKHVWSDAMRRAASARMAARNADPDFKARASARMKALHADPDFKARMRPVRSATLTAYNRNPANRAANSARQKGRKRPDVSARMKELHANPAFRARYNAAMAARDARRNLKS